MTSTTAPYCLGCLHFRKNSQEFQCTAYPDGIPEPILSLNVDHRAPYEGDHGIQFAEAEPWATEKLALHFDE